jgi:hypothetical protein
LAYVSHTAALLDLSATASVPLAKAFSACAKKKAHCAAAKAATITALVDNTPGINDPTIGAGNTLHEKLFHLSDVRMEFCSICSDALNHVRPTKPDLANLRFPTLIALDVNCRVS